MLWPVHVAAVLAAPVIVELTVAVAVALAVA